MTSAAKKGGGKDEPHMSDADLAFAKQFFGDDISDADLQKLFKKTYA